MKDILYLSANIWLVVSCFYYGWQFIRRYDNYLLGLECLVVGTSGTNFLLWALFSGSDQSPMYQIAIFLDAFSRSVGITLILALGLMKVTHRYRPGFAADVAVFGLAAVAGLFLRQFYHEDLTTNQTAFAVASFYVAVNLATAVFLAYFVKRLWDAGAKWQAVSTALVSAAATTVALTYDFFPLPFDDANRTIFYTFALATWGTQAFVYFHAYKALDAHNKATDAKRMPAKAVLA